MQSNRLCPTGLRDALDLLNPWQRDFPLVHEPYAVLGQRLGRTGGEVLALLHSLRAHGALSRIGGVFSARAGGSALLAAMAVPVQRLHEVAAQVSAHPGVNHNYEREDRFNLWFVMTACDDAALELAMQGLERTTGLDALRLPMLRPYRIDLGFDLRAPLAATPDARPCMGLAPAVADKDRALAALLEEGLPLVERPYDQWARTLGCETQGVLGQLQAWLRAGTLRRFGAIVRHHEFGFQANAMTVFDVPDAVVDSCGERLARQPGVTLAYRRQRADAWPFNLYCMVHGTDRQAVRDAIARAVQDSGLTAFPQRVLFSRQRFKQTGARRFRALPDGWGEAAFPRNEVGHAVA
jgi:DNA-binding Lrp family transcriptional regulator